MQTPEVSIVVVHHRGLEHLLEALAALDAALGEGLTGEVLLVDNASGTPQDEVLRRHPTVRRVPSAVNVGFAAGCRLGVEAARAPVVLFVNDDAAVLPDAPRLLVSALTAADADVAAVGGRLTDRTGRRNDFSDGFLTFDGHAFAAHVGAPGRKPSPGGAGRGAPLRLRRADGRPARGFPRGRIRRRLFRLPRRRRLRVAAMDRRAPDPRRAEGGRAAPRRRDGRGARRLLAGLPVREERVRDGLQELRPRTLPGPHAGGADGVSDADLRRCWRRAIPGAEEL